MTSVAERPAARTLQVPPHSVEAEESVLGAVLLSAEAANIALEKLHGEDFYRPAHQQVFEAVQGLFDENEPIDAVTVSEVLRRDGSLELMGGIDFLTRLLDAVPTTSNIEYYADIVEEHALRRRLMRVAGTIGSIARSRRSSSFRSGGLAPVSPPSTRCLAPLSRRRRSCSGSVKR